MMSAADPLFHPYFPQASDAQLAAAAAGKHLPVRPLEESVYKERLGDTAYLVRVYA
jgi:hypothetical protein